MCANLAKYVFGLCMYFGCEKTSGSVHLLFGFLYPLAVKKSLVMYIFPLAVCILWLWKNFWMCIASILWHYVSSGCVCRMSDSVICMLFMLHQASSYVLLTSHTPTTHSYLNHKHTKCSLMPQSLSLAQGPWLGNVITNCECQYGPLPWYHL